MALRYLAPFIVISAVLHQPPLISAQQNDSFLDSPEASTCINCLCEFKRLCGRTGCDGNQAASSRWCGPFRISKPYWTDAGSIALPGENSTLEDTRFVNCAQDFNCSIEVIRSYTRNFMTDCDEDGNFTCVDLGRMFFSGFNCKGFIDHDTKTAVDIFLTCFAELSGTHKARPGTPFISSDSHNSMIVLYVCLGLVILFIGSSILIVCVLYRKRMLTQRSGIPTVQQIARKTKITPDDVAITVPLSIIIQPTELVLRKDKILGQGHFGVVYEGTFNGTPVAVKEPKLNLLNTTATREFEKELEMMASVGKHQFIVEFFGAEISLFKKGIVHVVLELSRYGSLLDVMRGYAKENQIKLDESKLNEYVNLRPGTVGVSDLGQGLYKIRLRWSYQIASGMAYLESKKIMHGDLAARNVLLFNIELVKLSDFGFARNLENYDEYQKSDGPMPWRWMAPESLERRIFSVKSDVWSYGITLWEVFTFGVVPNGGLQYCTPEYCEGLKKGDRLGRPEGATTEIYMIMLDCWKLDQDSRPSFACLEGYFLNLFNDYSKTDGTANDYQEFSKELDQYFQKPSEEILSLDSK